jgi:hypothetical protein
MFEWSTMFDDVWHYADGFASLDVVSDGGGQLVTRVLRWNVTQQWLFVNHQASLTTSPPSSSHLIAPHPSSSPHHLTPRLTSSPHVTSSPHHLHHLISPHCLITSTTG